MAPSSKVLSDIFDFARAGPGGYIDDNGVYQTAAANEARFHYLPGIDTAGLLIEEQLENLAPYSENRGHWGEVGLTNPAATTLSNGIGGTEFDDADVQYCGVYDVDNAAWLLNANTNTYDAASGSEVARERMTFTSPVGCTTVRVYIARRGATAEYSYAEVSGLTESTQYTASFFHEYNGTKYKVGGEQNVPGDLLGSYFPTDGSPQTRAKDSNQHSSTWFNTVFNSSAGTLFWDFSVPGSCVLGGFSDGSFDNCMYCSIQSDGTVYFFIRRNGAQEASINLGTYTFGTRVKVVVALDDTEVYGSLGGAAAASAVVTALPTLTGGAQGHAPWGVSGHINGVLYDWRYARKKHTVAAVEAAAA